MTLPIVLDHPIAFWAGPAALVVALVALVLEVVRRRPPPAEPVIATADEAWRAGFEERVAGLERRLPAALQHAGLVRFDAFPGAGGQFSFSVALLDGRRSGLVLTAITGRDETRLYAKWVDQGRCAQALSPEEESALGQALGRAPEKEDR